MGSYAEGTEVSVERTKAEIEKVLTKYGADQYLSGWDTGDSAAFVAFRAHGKHIKFRLELPHKDDKAFKFTPHRRYIRRPDEAIKAWEQACRARWRSLLIVIKAKLEAVNAGITVFEDEFLAQIVLPDGQTAGEWLRPQIKMAYENGQMPRALVGIGGPTQELLEAQ